MMEQLAERRMRREEDAQYASVGLGHPSTQSHNHGPPLDDDGYEEEEEDDEEYDSQDDEEYDDEESVVLLFYLQQIHVVKLTESGDSHRRAAHGRRS